MYLFVTTIELWTADGESDTNGNENKDFSPPSHISHKNHNQVLDKSYAHKIIGEWSLYVNIKFIQLTHSLQNSNVTFCLFLS